MDEEKTVLEVVKEGAAETVAILEEYNSINDQFGLPEVYENADKMQKLMDTSAALINNASQREFNKFDDMTFDEWRFVMSINLDSLFHTCKAVIPSMKENKWGRIINLGGLICAYKRNW